MRYRESQKTTLEIELESSSNYMLETPASSSELSFAILQIVLSQKGYPVDNLSLEKKYHLRNRNGEYNLLAELLSDNNNIHLFFVKYRGTTKAAISQRDNYGGTSIIASYLQIRSRLVSENVCTVDTTVRPRKETYLFDLDAVNEAVINALVHNDWNINEPIIKMFDDRLEIISHRGLPDNTTKEEFLNGVSIPRNSALMKIFKDLEITYGIQQLLEVYGKEAFEMEDSSIKVVIPFNRT